MKKQTNLPASGRKLSLNKKTISNLQPMEMGKKVGGGTSWGGPCGSRCFPVCGTQKGKTCPGHNTCYNC